MVQQYLKCTISFKILNFNISWDIKIWNTFFERNKKGATFMKILKMLGKSFYLKGKVRQLSCVNIILFLLLMLFWKQKELKKGHELHRLHIMERILEVFQQWSFPADKMAALMDYGDILFINYIGVIWNPMTYTLPDFICTFCFGGQAFWSTLRLESY